MVLNATMKLGERDCLFRCPEAIFDRVVREDLSEEMTPDQRPDS